MSPGIERILFSTDFSECSEQALHYALLWAKTYEAKLDCVHVLPLHPHLDVEGAVIQNFLDEQIQEINHRCQSSLKYKPHSDRLSPLKT